MANLNDCVIRDLSGITITVYVSPVFKLRVWIARRLIQLAALVVGANHVEKLEVA